jgi:hypothetical protein
MSFIRQDAWSQAEDSRLAEIILKHIESGSTQLAGFAEAAPILSRTVAACGFRWNSVVRRQFGQELSQAKQKRKELKANKGKRVLPVVEPETGKDSLAENSPAATETLDAMIQFLLDLKHNQGEGTLNQESLEALQLENHKLKEENQLLRRNSDAFMGVMNLLDQARKQSRETSVNESGIF